MKKISLFLFSLFVLQSVAVAHPPSDVKIGFDLKTQTLNAVVVHRVSNPATHYIYKVDIALNGKEIKTLTFEKQLDRKEQAVTVVLPQVKAGDFLSVEGYCNLSGKLEKKIRVG